MRKLLVLILCFSIVKILSAQNVGIGTTTPAAKLDIASSNPSSPTNSDGILLPRVNSFPTTDPAVNQNGMIVYLTTASGTYLSGFYYWDNNSSSWKGVGENRNWNLTGNAGTNAANNFIGTTDDNDVFFKRNNVRVDNVV